jgi:peptidoglycan hydrolase-like protein with peptidoglycan-binding domain
MQMSPSRVETIQQALINAGTLHGTPTGHWDSETRDAMARYQDANGFGVTGLPDAKSLMKLGLGPHPLPAELNKAPAASGADPAASPAAPPDKPASDASESSQAPPSR